MTTLTGTGPGQSYGDILTCTNAGNGLTNVLQNVQDGRGNNSAVQISTTQFKTVGNMIIQAAAADPVNPVDGMMYVNTGANTLRYYSNGVWRALTGV